MHDIHQRWRRIADEYAATPLGPRVFVAEAWLSPADRLAQYVRPNELHSAFNFDALQCPWDATELREVIDHTTEHFWAVGAPATWVLSNHDTIRHRTRYGRDQKDASMPAGTVPTDLELGRRRARAAALLELALPGGAYIYQGDELGLPEVEDLPEDVLDDPTWERSGHTVRGRDGCRVPIPWSGTEPPFGFGTGAGQPWLPQPADWSSLTAEAQASDPDSHLSLYKAALRIRRSTEALGEGRLSWDEDAPRRRPLLHPHPPTSAASSTSATPPSRSPPTTRSCSPASRWPTASSPPTPPPGSRSDQALCRQEKAGAA